MKEKYINIVMMTERLHRLFLDVVKKEIDRQKILDINSVQCLILYNIGDSKLSVSEISHRGYYLGSNVSYNLKKMVTNRYILQRPAPHDKRASQVMLSEKGKAIYAMIDTLITRQLSSLEGNQIGQADLAQADQLLRHLETFWSFLLTKEGRS